MTPTKYPLLTTQEQLRLDDAMHYMKVGELKRCCEMLGLSAAGKKAELIARILFFAQTGKGLQLQKMAPASLAKNHPPQRVAANALMLHGSYKNDAQTRAFFKKLIGSHFHFTAFGVDWLNERWMQGKPPTYQEFADYWVEETMRRSKKKPEPKREWALINFMQKMAKEQPNAPREVVMAAWKKLRAEKSAYAKKIIAEFKQS
jgi:hypothetical protein